MLYERKRAGARANQCLAAVALLQATVPFQIVTTHLPLPQPGHEYEVQLQAEGGTPPYAWSAKLPPGLTLNPATGEITGVAPQHCTVLVRVRDAANPPLEITRLLTTSAGPPLDLQWRPAPEVADGQLTGAVVVGNGTGERATLTVIIVAVNGIGKAFALRYDHELVEPGRSTPILKFSEALPPGTYTVHVDAVAEIPATGEIYRDRLEQSGMVVGGGGPPNA